MKAAIENSKSINQAMLGSMWAGAQSGTSSSRLTLMLHGFCMFTNMDRDEPEAYNEMRFLREFASGRQIDLEEY